MPAPRNARTTNRGRSYIWPPTGEEFVSVTTALSAGIAKPGLTYWAARLVAEGATARLDEWLAIREAEGDEAAIRFLKGLPWDKRDKAADAGTAVHAAIDAERKGLEAPHWPTRLVGFHRQYERFKEAYRPEWIASEATVYNRTYGYAGTLDWIAGIVERVTLGDVKSGERIYDEVSLQLAAYRYAEWIDLGDSIEHPMPVVDAAAVLHLRPQVFHLREVEADEAKFRSFLHVLQVYRFTQEIAVKSPVGEIILPANLVPSGAEPSLDDLLKVSV